MAATPTHRTICNEMMRRISELEFRTSFNPHSRQLKICAERDGLQFFFQDQMIHCRKEGAWTELLWFSNVWDGKRLRNQPYFMSGTIFYGMVKNEIEAEREREDLRKACRRLPKAVKKSTTKTTRRL